MVKTDMPSNAPKRSTQPGWHQQDIQHAIRKRGTTLAELSRQSGLARGTLQTIFYKRYPRGQQIVADFIGVSLHELWPDWYGPDNSPRPLEGRLHVRAGQ